MADRFDTDNAILREIANTVVGVFAGALNSLQYHGARTPADKIE